MNWQVWGPPIAIFGLGVVAGLIMVRRARGADLRAGPDRLEELTARRVSLLEQLRTLEADRGKLGTERFSSQWDELLDSAARNLRDIERAVSANDAEASDVSDAQPSVNRASRMGLWFGGTVAFFVVLGLILNQFTSVRTAGGSMTGAAVSSNAARAAREAAAEATLAKDPSDLDALNTLGYAALQRGDLRSAMQLIDRARAIAPEDPQVRVHLAIMQLAVGMIDRARNELDAALATDPTLSKALLWRGLIEMRSGSREAAIPWLERALESASTAEARQIATRALTEARTPPPVVRIRGTLAYASSQAPVDAGVLFVMVRRSAEGGGPPVAALRLDVRGVPGGFTVTDRDMMMQGEWPEQVWIEARVDVDGNPMTRGDGDLVTALVGPLEAGAGDVQLVLGDSTAAAGSAAEPPDAAPQDRLRGSIGLADGVSRPTEGAVFVIVRRSAAPAGPPVAALRLPPTAVPGDFSVGDDDIMLGGPWPDQVWVQARLDGDGNAMTREPGDLASAVVGPLSQNGESVTLTITR